MWDFWLWFLVINISNYFSRNFSEQQLLVLLLLPLRATTIINLSIPFTMPIIFEILKEYLISRKPSDMTLNLTSVSFMSLAIRLAFLFKYIFNIKITWKGAFEDNVDVQSWPSNGPDHWHRPDRRPAFEANSEIICIPCIKKGFIIWTSYESTQW